MFCAGVISKLPRFFILVFLVINIFLVTFIFMGCINKSASFSNVYLVEYSYNQDSVFFDAIKSSFKQSNATDLAYLKARSGFFGACATVSNATECVSRGNLTALEDMFPSLSITQSGTNSSALGLVQLATQFTGDIVHPSLPVVTLVLDVLVFVFVLWSIFAFIPGATQAGIMMMWTSICAFLTWSVCTIWFHVSTLVGTIFIESSSAGAVTSAVGGRIKGMIWTTFTFQLLIGLLAVWTTHKSSIQKAKKEADYEARAYAVKA
ncbi:Ca2+ regulator and membrane fusion protein Fig1-domain-containing protein [Yarrowia lipolytica]|jgi:hypothetical protein|uniref:Ca2+ regulator and membrane fusion protein Fig1-domain-containing protein n=1 Tax=Yarrowia lipolytica TaxID=4952 RepID=A0A1H6QBH0_YARLL|nr:hypothetical protein YALI1_A13962g [Yarrowia lipolytica]KAB8283256.1 Ca2+ regulator and membrane fusion protein Fig1-domain-containing protein [Yarrowia lipolytica]KAE8174049.1 Ca2+ regulator and membrane fusion protein Fig1-domain-containing protein [Yarrowia lipolytica]KAJ8051651.1 Ca2+ regulator and membrane fusion protein Fig1-domain-containing protein [Yarrowia lipolytica]QNP95219.1 Hypothetical protein YALI2_A00218g [Yarrowia lipolytica]